MKFLKNLAVSTALLALLQPCIAHADPRLFRLQDTEHSDVFSEFNDGLRLTLAHPIPPHEAWAEYYSNGTWITRGRLLMVYRPNGLTYALRDAGEDQRPARLCVRSETTNGQQETVYSYGAQGLDATGECAVACFEDSKEVVLHLIIRDYKNLPIVTHSGVADEDGYLANKVIPQITKLEETVPKTGISRALHTQGENAYLTCVYRYTAWPSTLGAAPIVRVRSMSEWPLPQGADIVKGTNIKVVRGITYDRYNRVTTPLTRVAVRALDTGPGTDCAGYTRET